MRPHQSFGTVELRNADGAPDVREAIALAAFGYLMAARALRAIDEGEPAGCTRAACSRRTSGGRSGTGSRAS